MLQKVAHFLQIIGILQKNSANTAKKASGGFQSDKLFQRNAIEVPQTLGICCPYIVLNIFERNEYTESSGKDEYTNDQRFKNPFVPFSSPRTFARHLT